jgi:hypothetical protein
VAFRFLIFGSREWKDRSAIRTVVRGLASYGDAAYDGWALIHGGQRGADALADMEAKAYKRTTTGTNGEVLPFPAIWPPKGSPKAAVVKAGHNRNRRMLEEGKPMVAFCFKDGFGTAHGPDGEMYGGSEDMALRCDIAGVPVYVVSRFKRPGR